MRRAILAAATAVMLAGCNTTRHEAANSRQWLACVTTEARARAAAPAAASEIAEAALGTCAGEEAAFSAGATSASPYHAFALIPQLRDEYRQRALAAVISARQEQKRASPPEPARRTPWRDEDTRAVGI